MEAKKLVDVATLEKAAKDAAKPVDAYLERLNLKITITATDTSLITMRVALDREATTIEALCNEAAASMETAESKVDVKKKAFLDVVARQNKDRLHDVHLLFLL